MSVNEPDQELVDKIVELQARGINYTPEENEIYDAGGRWYEGLQAVYEHRARTIIEMVNESNEASRIAVDIVTSEPFLWLMAGSNHVETQVALLRRLWLRYRDAGGKSWGKS